METKKGFYYGYDWKNKVMRGPVEGSIELRHYMEKTYFIVDGIRMYRVMRKPETVNAARVINVWLEERDDEKARELISSVLIKRMEKLKKEYKALDESWEDLMIKEWS